MAATAASSATASVFAPTSAPTRATANPLDFAYYTFKPRPDQSHRHDQQTAFLNSKHPGVTFLLGGNGAGTSTLALRKAVDFMLETPPPRRDTPFWIIADSYEQTMNVCWKEKLHNLGHLPPQEIEWERIRWYKPNNDWPFAVPLRPWPDRPGKNWQIVFKSYDQGRSKMQGESIGGFLFVEQFPWGLLEEVLRGCREYSFLGNKLAEFTPVDPALSMPLQEMEENNDLPPGWAIYRANTECAVEQGHVTRQWFDQFFGMVPESMRGVRTKGLWGGFEGAVYPEFDTAIHCVSTESDPPWDVPPNCHHRRMIDWGFGADNAFCCLFACRNGVGQWFVYDEYYSTDTRYTVVDHLKVISDMHPWPLQNPYYGVTWADPSNINCHRIASRFTEYAPGYDSINCQGGNNARFEGIEHVKWLLKPDPALAMPNRDGTPGIPQPRLFICRENCPNLVRQMRTYRYLQSAKTGLNPRDAVQEVLKADDHACFVAGSMVDTPSGPRPIETLKRGDKVYSHRGIATVDIGAEMTGIRETFEVTLADSRSIECTAEHPLAISQKDWCKAADSVGQFVNVRNTCEPQQLETGILSRSSIMAGMNGGDTQAIGDIQPEDISVEANDGEGRVRNCVISGYTNKSTSTTSGRSLMGMTYTTRTKTLGIIRQETLRHCRELTTRNGTPKTSQKQSSRQLTGTAQTRANRGTVAMVADRGRIEAREFSTARNVELNFRHGIQGQKRGFVPDFADTNPGYCRESITSLPHACHVGQSSAQTAIARRKLARLNVDRVESVSVKKQPGKKEVFNLSTSDGTFFVNGVLVSNCDALRYGVYSEAAMSGITPSTMARQHTPGRHGVQVDSKRLNRRVK